MTTLRYRAASRIPYAQAIAALASHARNSGADYDFGPLDLPAMLEQGLLVTGPDLQEVAQLLNQIPGLHPSDE